MCQIVQTLKDPGNTQSQKDLCVQHLGNRMIICISQDITLQYLTMSFLVFSSSFEKISVNLNFFEFPPSLSSSPLLERFDCLSIFLDLTTLLKVKMKPARLVRRERKTGRWKNINCLFPTGDTKQMPDPILGFISDSSGTEL